MQIPVWRVVADGHGGDWTLVADACLRPPVEAASPGAASDVLRLWDADIEALIREESTCSEQLHCPPKNHERRNCFSTAKENCPPKPMCLGLLAEKNSEGVSSGLSPRKRGILTENPTLCNGSAVVLKRQRLHKAPCITQADVPSLFQTASSKAVQISFSAMEKARALLGFDDIRPCTAYGNEQCIPSRTPFHVASGGSEVSDDYQKHFKDSVAVRADEQPMFQTASSKPVQISFSSMQKAKALLNFDDVGGPWTTSVEKRCPPSNGPCEIASSMGNFSVNFKRHLKDNAAVRGITKHNADLFACPIQPVTRNLLPVNHNKASTGVSIVDHASLSYGLDGNQSTNMFQPISSSNVSVKKAADLLGEEDIGFPSNAPQSSTCLAHVEKHNPQASSFLFQTASGKAVSVSESGMLRAAQLLSNTEASNSDITPCSNMFQTARDQSVSVSTSGVKQAAKLLGEENYSFSLEAPLSSPAIRFVTATGKSVSVSSKAMKRAKDLLGRDLDNTEVMTPAHLVNRGEHNSQQLFETSEGHLIKVSTGSIERARLLLKDGALNTSFGMRTLPFPDVGNDVAKSALNEVLPSRKSIKTRHNHVVQESNNASMNKKGAMPRKVVASFKAPRRLQPAMAPASNSYCKEAPNKPVKYNFSQLVNLNPVLKKEKKKSSLKDFFKQQPHEEIELRHLANEIRMMTSESAKTYRFSSTIDGLESVGSDEFRMMLLEVGAKSQVVTKEWVDNHYRWIVWKLASLERSYPSKVGNKFLTVQTVFDELRYRYERELDCAHRSAIKKITEGDAAAGRMMVLCIAAVDIKEQTQPTLLEGFSTPSSADSETVYVEVTDGWYSLIAHLDPPLIRQLKAGKVFIGQKIRVCGATLLGCTTPLPPLEAFQVMKLALNMNGTYRAHWMDKLGLCKSLPIPLAFHCIKPDGGVVPRTILGIHRIYPILYCERLPNGGSITRSTRAEDLAVRGYHDRRTQVAEDAVIRMEREGMPLMPESEMGEGAKIFQLLENSAEPELLMADMSAAQHAAFAAYQAKREAARQSLVQKNILKALGEVHLDSREVTPFMKISVMGLRFVSNEPACKNSSRSKSTKGGIVTVWHVTEEQADGLTEGAVYCVSNLCPLPGRSGARSRNTTLHLRATKTSNWQLLPQSKFSCFTPRKVLLVSMLGTLPFRSEFDVAVLIVHVGKPYASGLYQRQWLFASDGSLEEEFSQESKKLISLLAIDLSTSNDAFLPVERALEGCIIGYCNLVKRCRDPRNNMWVAEASEISVFSSNFSAGKFLHLKEAAENVSKWVKSSERFIAKLEERIQKAVAGGP